MVEITAAMVRELREGSGAGMMDCKKALTETNGDMEAAVDWLRTKGLSAAAKKADRVAAEGLIGVVARDRSGAIVEINAETDFVGRNDKFQELVRKISVNALGHTEAEEGFWDQPYGQSSHTIREAVTELVATIGENLTPRRMRRVQVDNGIVVSYVHNSVGTNLGRIGVLIALESTGDQKKLEELGKQLAMHVAAAHPKALTRDEVPAELLARERAIAEEKALESGRPADVQAKMVEGQIRKFYEESVLLEQLYVIDGKTKIAEVLTKAEKEIGAPLQLAAFVRFALGEGIEKKQSDFAAEVAAQIK